MYKTLIRPVLDRLDSERWHTVAREFLHLTEQSSVSLRILEHLTTKNGRFCDTRLNLELSGIKLENPLLVGAGWDKDARAVRALWTLGFAGVEVGSVLEYPQPGNPRPRQFMLNSGVCLNWLGFNSKGMEKVYYNLGKYSNDGIPLGISIGINKFVMPKHAPLAHAAVAEYLYDFASYFAINVSSPNTQDLRKLQDREKLDEIVKAVKDVNHEHSGDKPVFVKIAPELDIRAVDDVIEIVLENGIAGIIATNTTNNPEIKAKYGERWKNLPGGISGDDEDFRKMSNEKISHIYRQAGDRIDVIGVGGIKDTETALEKIRSGARALQIVTGLRGEGLSLPDRINRGLVEYMEREGIDNITDLTGSDS